MRTLLRHGTIVNADGQRRADVLVDGERVAAIGAGLSESADRVIDATGRLLLPGGVDVHTHLDMPFGDIRTADDFASGTIAAACGGTTTVVDYATQAKGGSLREALDEWMARAAGQRRRRLRVPRVHRGPPPRRRGRDGDRSWPRA